MRKVSLLLALAAFTGAALASRPAAAQSSQTGQIRGGADADAEKGKVPFWGFGLGFAIYDSSSVNTVNYSNDLSFYITPSWAVGKLIAKNTRFSTLRLSLRIPIIRTLYGYDEGSYAYDSDLGPPIPCSTLTPSTQGGTIDPNAVKRCDYPQYHRTQPGDLWLTLSNPRIVTIPVVGIAVSPAIRVTIPTSKESQYQTLRAGLSGILRFDRPFWNDRIDIGYSFGFNKNFHRFTSPVGQNTSADGDTVVGYSPNYFFSNAIDPNDPNPFNATGIGRNSSYSFQHIFNIDIHPTEKLSISVLYILNDAFRYPVPDTWTDPRTGMTYNTYETGMAVAGNSGSNILRTGHTDMQILWASIGYDLTDWMDVSLAWINASPQRKPDGSLRQPFFGTDYNAFSQVNFGFNFVIERLGSKLLKK